MMSLKKKRKNRLFFLLIFIFWNAVFFCTLFYNTTIRFKNNTRNGLHRVRYNDTVIFKIYDLRPRYIINDRWT